MTNEPQSPSRGGPSVFSQDIADRICARLMGEESLKRICADSDMPSRSTVHAWLVKHEEFKAQYDEAWKVKRENWADDIIDISDKPLIGEKTTTKGDKIEKTVGDNVERSKLMTENRKWMLARMDPNRFGDRIRNEHTGADGAPLTAAINLTVGADPTK